MTDVTGFGFQLNVVGDTTFPAGFDVTQFADDADPFDTPEIKIADMKLGLNGDPITWSLANPTEVKVAVVPGSDDDVNLGILFNANRVGPGKASAQDEISMVGVYPDGRVCQLTQGRITAGFTATSISSAGRQKSKVYTFMFPATSGSPA